MGWLQLSGQSLSRYVSGLTLGECVHSNAAASVLHYGLAASVFQPDQVWPERHRWSGMKHVYMAIYERAVCLCHDLLNPLCSGLGTGCDLIVQCVKVCMQLSSWICISIPTLCRVFRFRQYLNKHCTVKWCLLCALCTHWFEGHAWLLK